MRKFEITIRIDGFDGELTTIIEANNRGDAHDVAHKMCEENGIEIDTADVGLVGKP